MARRVTSFQGQTSNPHFRRRKMDRFSGEYAGNLDVYLVAADGGEPKRLTWHPRVDLVQGWTARRKSDHVLLGLRATMVAERRAALLDRTRGRRRGRTNACWPRGYQENLRRRQSPRLSHEQFVTKSAATIVVVRIVHLECRS